MVKVGWVEKRRDRLGPKFNKRYILLTRKRLRFGDKEFSENDEDSGAISSIPLAEISLVGINTKKKFVRARINHNFPYFQTI